MFAKAVKIILFYRMHGIFTSLHDRGKNKRRWKGKREEKKRIARSLLFISHLRSPHFAGATPPPPALPPFSFRHILSHLFRVVISGIFRDKARRRCESRVHFPAATRELRKLPLSFAPNRSPLSRCKVIF